MKIKIFFNYSVNINNNNKKNNKNILKLLKIKFNKKIFVL